MKIERISTDQLNQHCNTVRAHIRRTRKHGGDTRDAEMELCYLERELEHREKSMRLDRQYRARIDAARKAEAQTIREEEEALKSYWESTTNQGLDG